MSPTVGVAPGTISLVINQAGLGQMGPQRVFLTDPIQPASTTPIVYIGAGPPRYPSAQACHVCAGGRLTPSLGDPYIPDSFFEQQAQRENFVKKAGIAAVLGVTLLGVLATGAGVLLVVKYAKKKPSGVSGSAADDLKKLQRPTLAPFSKLRLAETFRQVE